MTRHLLALIVLIHCSSAAANATLCPKQTSKAPGEGVNGPIAEESFTEEKARAELKRVQSIMAPEGVAADAVAWENAFVYIEGWFLKRQALRPANERPRHAVSDFCTFMEKRAYLRD